MATAAIPCSRSIFGSVDAAPGLPLRIGEHEVAVAERAGSRASTASALLAVTPAGAQETGTVRGTVTLLETGGLVDGAVMLIVGTGAFALAEDGRFEITSVPAGSYEVTAQRDRLTAAGQTVTVTPGGTATADFALNLSPVREEVTVTAAAVGAAATPAVVQRGHHRRLAADRPPGPRHRRGPRVRAGRRQLRNPEDLDRRIRRKLNTGSGMLNTGSGEVEHRIRSS